MILGPTSQQAGWIEANFSVLTDKAICLLMLQSRPLDPVALGDIVKTLEDTGLSQGVNRSRFRMDISRRKELGFCRKSQLVKIQPAFLVGLQTTHHSPDAHIAPQVQSHIIDAASVPERTLYKSLVGQINGTFEFGYFDATAVLMRRLVECLLIEAFDKTGNLNLITDENGDFKMLKGIVGKISSAGDLRLSRTARPALDIVKRLGDQAAHHRYHVTTKSDIDTVAVAFRSLVSELKALAGLS